MHVSEPARATGSDPFDPLGDSPRLRRKYVRSDQPGQRLTEFWA